MINHISDLPGGWPDPELLTPFDASEATEVARSIVPAVRKLLSDPSSEVVHELFHRDAFWRDCVGLSWDTRTLHTAKTIAETALPWVKRAKVPVDSVKLVEEQIAPINLPNGLSCVRVPFTFTSTLPAPASCTAAFKVVRLLNDTIKVFVATTAMRELHQMPLKTLDSTPMHKELPKSVDVLVAGGGHAGLAISAYLKAFGIDFVCIDREAQVGDAWSNRYDSAQLHTTRRFSGLPFKPFPSDYPEYVPAKLVGKYYAEYVRDFGLPVFCGREVMKIRRKASEGPWDIELSTGETFEAKNIVFAIGLGGRYPYTPTIAGQDRFRGITLHSAEYKNAKDWKGKRVAVIGSSTTSFDVCHDAYMAGAAEVTMVQRGPTRVYPEGHIGKVQKNFWNDQIPIEVGDIMATEDPIALQAPLAALLMKRFNDEHDPAYWQGLKNAGFQAISEGPVHQQIFIHAGKHYPDIGAADAIIKGHIKVKNGLESFTESGIVFKDGSELPVDVLIYATGFDKDVRKQINAMAGQDLGLPPIWGLDDEGEVRGVFRPVGDGSMFVFGSEMQLLRYMARPLALQLAGQIMGVRPSC